MCWCQQLAGLVESPVRLICTCAEAGCVTVNSGTCRQQPESPDELRRSTMGWGMYITHQTDRPAPKKQSGHNSQYTISSPCSGLSSLYGNRVFSNTPQTSYPGNNQPNVLDQTNQTRTRPCQCLRYRSIFRSFFRSFVPFSFHFSFLFLSTLVPFPFHFLFLFCSFFVPFSQYSVVGR
jgi:hypothetical protein